MTNTMREHTYSAIILAGGSSKRFGKDKALVELLGKPMIMHVYDRVASFVDEVIIVVSSIVQFNKYKNLTNRVSVIIDEGNFQGPLIGALAGFKGATGEYSLLLSCDTPLLSGKIISLFLELAVGYDAVISRWPNNYIEPLQAVYKTKAAYTSALVAIENRAFRMLNLVMGLKRVLYISTLFLRNIDPHLDTFRNVNTQSDLAEVEKILRSHN